MGLPPPGTRPAAPGQVDHLHSGFAAVAVSVWWGENSKCAHQESFRNLERALRDFTRSKNGRRKGKRLGFPKYKKRGRCREAFRFGTGLMRCSGSTVTLPRLGTVRTHEDTGKLAAKVAAGTARVLSATVSLTAQRWFASFTVEAERDVPQRHPRPGTAIGIDLGVRALLTGADDGGRVITVAGPGPLRASLRSLRRASRDCSRKRPGSANRRKSAARLARLHARVADGYGTSANKHSTATVDPVKFTV